MVNPCNLHTLPQSSQPSFATLSASRVILLSLLYVVSRLFLYLTFRSRVNTSDTPPPLHLSIPPLFIPYISSHLISSSRSTSLLLASFKASLSEVRCRHGRILWATNDGMGSGSMYSVLAWKRGHRPPSREANFSPPPSIPFRTYRIFLPMIV